jgi:hypothetical protein
MRIPHEVWCCIGAQEPEPAPDTGGGQENRGESVRPVGSWQACTRLNRCWQIMDGQLTWLVYMVGAIIGGHSSTDLHTTDGQESIDASMASRCMQLAQVGQGLHR